MSSVQGEWSVVARDGGHEVSRALEKTISEEKSLVKEDVSEEKETPQATN